MDIRGVHISESDPKLVLSVSDIEQAQRAVSQGADILEIRCDYMQPADLENIVENVEDIRANVDVPLIGSIRNAVNFGTWYKTEEDYALEIFKEIMPNLDAVDVEFDSKIKDNLIRLARFYNKKVILGYYEVWESPSELELINTARTMYEQDCDIMRLTCGVYLKNHFEASISTLYQYIEKEPFLKTKPMAIVPTNQNLQLLFLFYGSSLVYDFTVANPEIDYCTAEDFREVLSMAKNFELPLKAEIPRSTLQKISRLLGVELSRKEMEEFYS